jgi:hypothetical protein
MRLRRLGKRGMEDKLSFVMWEMIVILIVVIALTVAVRGIANNTNYWKKYHSADLALMTDLMFVHQGDFVIYYDMKDLRKNFVTNTLRIEPLVFQTFLKDNSYFIYDTSIDKDRFPKSYIFAGSEGIRVINSNMTSDYIVLYKSGTEIGMKSNEIRRQISCSSINTVADLKDKRFKAVGLDDTSKKHADYITESLKTLGTGQDDELLIGLNLNKEGLLETYNDAQSSGQGKSDKMACLVLKQLSDKYPDNDVKQIPYDDSMNTPEFTNIRNNYMYWIVINVNNSMTSKELSDVIRGAIIEYYGSG